MNTPLIAKEEMAGAVARLLPIDAQTGATLWIGGEWCAASSEESMPVLSPRDGTYLLRVAKAGLADVEKAVLSGRSAMPAWRDMDGSEREKILRGIAVAIRDNSAAFSLLETLDSGRPLRDTRNSVEGAARLFDFYAGLCGKILGRMGPSQPGRTSMIEYEPYGLFAAITPWNYPLSNAATKLAPILACGNAIVLKPAEDTPLVTILLARLMAEAGLPIGVCNILTGNGETGGALVDHAGVDRVSFTGSSETGRQIAVAAARRLKGCILELGGKSPMLVFADADLEKAADAAVFTTFNNQGQTCTSCNRILVQSSVKDRFTQLCEEGLADLRVGDPLDPDTMVGSLVSAGQVTRIERIVGTEPSRLLELPNYAPVEGGAFIAPRIIEVVDPASSIVREEVFGPVMTIQSFETDDEAWVLANSVDYGLAASVWTKSLDRAEVARRQCDVGVVWINCVHALSPSLPVSGRKDSGMGSEYGLDVIGQHMRLKTTVQMSGGWVSPFRVLREKELRSLESANDE